MTGFEIAGVILGAYPLIIGALEAYRATRGGKGAVSLTRILRTEQIIFGEFLHHLVAPNVSEMSLISLMISNSPDLSLWNNGTLQANMRARLGLEKADNVVEILEEIQELLRSLKEELSDRNDHGVELLRRFRVKVRQVRHNLPQSSLKERLDRLTAHNIQLQRLMTDRSLPSDSTHHKISKPSRRYLRHDPRRADDIYNAICSGYRCECNAPHLANISLPRISDDIRTDSGLISGWQFELLFAVEESAVDGDVPASSMELEGLMTTWSQIAIGGKTVSNSRRVSISECDNNHDPEKQILINDLCIFMKILDSEELASDPHVCLLKLKEKQYQLQKTPTPQGAVSQRVECLDHLLEHPDFLLDRKERICLALSLSHAILSVYSTHWVEKCWTWRDFCIDRENEGQIFARREFYSSHSGRLVPGSGGSLLSVLHGEPTLTRLGFALVELALGKRLVEMRSKNQYQSLDPDIQDFLTAQSLVDSGRIMRAESKTYEDVVRVCLRHQFTRCSEVIGLDSSRPSFQENAERSIIEPLHEIVKVSWGTL